MSQQFEAQRQAMTVPLKNLGSWKAKKRIRRRRKTKTNKQNNTSDKFIEWMKECLSQNNNTHQYENENENEEISESGKNRGYIFTVEWMDRFNLAVWEWQTYDTKRKKMFQEKISSPVENKKAADAYTQEYFQILF